MAEAVTSLPSSVQKVADAAAALGLTIDIRTMAQSTRTAAEAAAACNCAVGQIVKSLVFRGAGTGAPCLLLVSGRNRVDENKVAAILGETLRRPDADDVRTLTGFAIGGIPPFGHATPLATFMDEDLLAFEVVWAAAGTPFAVFAVAPQALGEAIAARVIRIV